MQTEEHINCSINGKGMFWGACDCGIEHRKMQARLATVSFQEVGEASSMPGTAGGFTMATFKGIDVPEGSKLYILKRG